MKQTLTLRKLITAIAVFVILLFFTAKTPSNKLIFLPFLLCAAANIGKSIGLLRKNERLARFFDRAFLICFFLCWFGFLAFACVYAFREGRYPLLLLTVPFWIGGVVFAVRRFQKKDR